MENAHIHLSHRTTTSVLFHETTNEIEIFFALSHRKWDRFYIHSAMNVEFLSNNVETYSSYLLVDC